VAFIAHSPINACPLNVKALIVQLPKLATSVLFTIPPGTAMLTSLNHYYS